MQDSRDRSAYSAVGHLTVRWDDDESRWLVYAWARQDGDSPYVDVHPMWQQPRLVADDDHASGTLMQLLTAVQRTVQRLERDQRSGQMTLW